MSVYVVVMEWGVNMYKVDVVLSTDATPALYLSPLAIFAFYNPVIHNLLVGSNKDGLMIMNSYFCLIQCCLGPDLRGCSPVDFFTQAFYFTPDNSPLWPICY